MLLQKARIGKTAVLVIILILLGTLATLPLFLQADNTGEGEYFLYLPSVFNDADGTPNPGTEVTATPTFTATSTIHPTITASATNTPTPIKCDIQFEGPVYADDSFVEITGDVGTEVTIVNLSDNNMTLGMGTLDGPLAGHACEGFASIPLSSPLDISDTGQVLLAVDMENPDNNDTTIISGPPTVTPSSTPVEPYIIAMPDCGPGPNIQFNLYAYNWPLDQSVTFFWQGTSQAVFQANTHPGSFNMTWSFDGLSDGIYTVSALSGTNGVTASDQIFIPCGIVPTNTPTSTSVPSNTPTPTSTSTPPNTPTPTATSTPTMVLPCDYGPHSASTNGPVRIQMEDFRCGGPGVSFNEQSDGGPGSGAYRIDYGAEGPDLEGTSDSGGGYNLGWTQPGEWLEYEILAPTSAVYTFIIRYAAPDNTNPRLQIRTSLGELETSTPILSLSPTGGFQDWQNYETQVVLFSGTNIVRFTIGSGPGNYNYFDVHPFIPTSTPTPVTPTPAPADLIVGQPILVSTPPLTSYEPIAFQVPITNTGDISIETLFFVDLLFDPAATFGSETYTAVSGLAGNNSTMLTITSTTGLDADLGTHQITAWVDSLNHIVEEDETNNLSTPLELVNVTPANTPIPTAVPIGTEPISGLALTLTSELLPIERAHITLIEEASGIPIASTYSDENGAYSLNNIPTDTGYTVQACIFINNQPYFGLSTGVMAPNAFANVILLPQPCP